MYCTAQTLLAKVCQSIEVCRESACCHTQNAVYDRVFGVYRYKASQQVLERAEDFCAQASATANAMSSCRIHLKHKRLCGFYVPFIDVQL